MMNRAKTWIVGAVVTSLLAVGIAALAGNGLGGVASEERLAQTLVGDCPCLESRDGIETPGETPCMGLEGCTCDRGQACPGCAQGCPCADGGGGPCWGRDAGDTGGNGAAAGACSGAGGLGRSGSRPQGRSCMMRG